MSWTREQMAARAALELRSGDYVNLGIGLPTLIADHLPPGVEVFFESENGLLGQGPAPLEADIDPDLVNAGVFPTSFVPGASIFSSSEGFGMIRGGHIDLAFLGGMQVSERGDLANWMVPGQIVTGMGGAMDLVAGARRVIVLMEHTSKSGEPKLVRVSSLPLTGVRVVGRVITDLAVLDVTPRGFELAELAAGVSLDTLRQRTDAPIHLPEPLSQGVLS